MSIGGVLRTVKQNEALICWKVYAAKDLFKTDCLFTGGFKKPLYQGALKKGRVPHKMYAAKVIDAVGPI